MFRADALSAAATARLPSSSIPFEMFAHLLISSLALLAAPAWAPHLPERSANHASLRDQDVAIHAVDAFGRPVTGLQLDVIVRAKDGTLGTVRCSVGDDGRADLSPVDGTVVHASAAGDWFARNETWWLDGDTERGLLTVVPLVPVEVTLASHEGEAQDVFAADFDTPDLLPAANAYLNGASWTEVGGATDDGTLEVRVPRGHSFMNVFLPGSLDMSGNVVVAEGLFAGQLTSIEFAITGGTQRFELRAPRLSPRPIYWYAGEEPVVDARWSPCETALFADPEFRRLMGGITGPNGEMAVFEELDDEGEPDRFLETAFRIGRDGEPDASYVFTIPVVPEDGFEIELPSEVPSVALPDAPEGFVWGFRGQDNSTAQMLVADGATHRGFEGRHQGWATREDASVARGVVHFDGWLWGEYDREVELEPTRGRVDLEGLPEVDWAIEAFGPLVEQDAAYVDHYVLTPLDDRGRARGFGPIGAGTSVLHGRGPGWCGDAMNLVDGDDGLAPVVVGDFVEVRFVTPGGEPAPFVRFEAEWLDVFMGPGAVAGWSDEQGRATVQRIALDDETDSEGTARFAVRLAPEEPIPGAVVPLEFDEDGVATVVVPQRGSLAIDATAIAGGDARPLLVRVAAGDAEDGGGDPRDRVDVTPTFTTNPDGTLVLDGVPQGTYRVWACDINWFFDGEAPSVVVTVD